MMGVLRIALLPRDILTVFRDHGVIGALILSRSVR